MGARPLRASDARAETCRIREDKAGGWGEGVHVGTKKRPRPGGQSSRISALTRLVCAASYDVSLCCEDDDEEEAPAAAASSKEAKKDAKSEGKGDTTSKASEGVDALAEKLKKLDVQ